MRNANGVNARRILLVATGVNFLAGLLYIWSILSKGLMSELHWTSSQASLPYTVANLSFVFAMALLGKLLDIKGPRICATFGGLFIGMGLIFSGLTTDPAIMVVTFGLITGAGVGLSAMAAISTALKWFPPSKSGFISGIVLGGVALSSIVYSPIINYLLLNWGISKALIISGLGIGLLMILLAQFLQNPPAAYVVQITETKDSSTKYLALRSIERNWKDLLRSKQFYQLWIMFAFTSTTGLMIYGHAANIAETQVHWKGGYLLVIFLALFNFIGRLVGGALADKIGRINLLCLVFAIQAVNMLLFSKYQTVGLLFIGVAIAGTCYGASFVVFPSATADWYGMKNYGTNYGLVSTAWGMGGVLGPMTAAKIFDTAHNYYAAYVVASILLLFALGTALFIRKTTPLQE